MEVFYAAATGLPTVVFTAAVAVVVCFWLLVAVGAVGVRSFDRDVDLRRWGTGGVPAAVVLSLLCALTWGLDLTITIPLAAMVPTGSAHLLLELVGAAVASTVAWRLTRAAARPLAKRWPDEPEPAGRYLAPPRV
ncbi:hypothetical protein [Streptomyces sp. NPDC051684]|uniref:hypothetical protein n=1 Tax=Streptomyces sp. NPDC051684 TaxID=3365670 RepID=UPI0037AA9B6E